MEGAILEEIPPNFTRKKRTGETLDEKCFHAMFETSSSPISNCVFLARTAEEDE
jgi:hypothetical protein